MSKMTQADVKRIAGEFTELALKTLADICMDYEAPAAARATAAVALLDRAHGKSVQAMEVSGPEGKPILVAGLDIGSMPVERLEAIKAVLMGVEEKKGLPEKKDA